METETAPQAIMTAERAPAAQTSLSYTPTPAQMDHGVTHNDLCLIIMLKSLPKQEHKPHLHNMQSMYKHVSLRRMHDLLPTSGLGTRLLFLNIHPNPK